MLLISVEKDAIGPPAGYPINIEIEGDDYDELNCILLKKCVILLILKILQGIDELKIDVNKDKPSMQVVC